MRLVNSMRQKIVKALLDHKFKAVQEKLALEQEAIGDLVYRHRMLPELEKLLTKANNLHPGASQLTNNVGVKTKMMQASAYYKLSSYRTCPHQGLGSNNNLSEELIVLVDAHELAKQNLTQEKETAKLKAEAVLATCNTLNQLEERWPEVMPIVREIGFVAPTKNLPAIPVADLNATFDLPIDKAA